MKAVQFDQYGDLDVLYLGELPAPSAGAGQVAVDVRAAGINRGGSSIRSGALKARFPLTFPSGQGWDAAGVVSALGPGVDSVAVGDQVACWGPQHASQAEQVALSAGQVVRRPPAVPWEVAGPLYLVGTTAYAAVQAGDTVAVSAAAGSVVVQVLRRLGAHVIGIASEANHAWLRSVGATPVLHGKGLEGRLRETAPQGMDAFINCFGDGYCQLAVDLGISPQRINTVADFAAAQKLGVKAEASAQASSSPTVSEIAEMVASGEVVIPVPASSPLAPVCEAYPE
ncbi:NADP-dependent oxidoreductase [Deinococcus sp. QL22]|uniref:NADP-dependent oxidoreductase n=1 Tax=Deinococcus sp. QL22 TaxID=2939437 RepID=UPI002017F1E3|nr:NADP-dependent oxidoreductase [Deinococcus sp. QL22]UQN08697.1 NADP-dependent oxidoreductase [Deinococcus sp. QL22]